MLAVPTRHRSVALLALTVLAQTLLLAYQIKRDSHVRLIRTWSVGTITPFERAGFWCISKVHGVWDGYFALVHAHRDNVVLQAEIDRLRMRNAQLEGDAAEARRLESIVAFHDTHADLPTVTARVVAANADSASRVLFINRGARDGIHRDMAVVTPDGVVGKIWEVFLSTSEVQLLTDDRSGVGVLLADLRVQGVVKGANDALPSLAYVSEDETVSVGAQVLTSGQDQIFPKDLPVGVVADVKPAPKGSPFKQIHVRPSARLDRLEEVIVLLTRQEINTRPAESAPTPKTGGASKPPAVQHP
jgi:rod shape-determining protein MreC